ncbi:MAG TPA: uroporphyrinogen-III synthase [Acidimicrobiia bacterium]
MTKPRLALTTTRDRALQLSDQVAGLGLEPVMLPCIELVPGSDDVIETARIQSARSDWLFLTSPRTVRELWPEGGMPKTRVAAVGQATAEAVRDAGGPVAVVGDGGARDLVDRISHIVAGQSVFVPHAANADRSTIDLLAGTGARVRTKVVYEMRPISPPDDPIDAIAFGSPSAVTGWFLSRDLEGLAVGVIGETTASAVAGHGHQFDVMPPSPSFGELTRLIAGHLSEGRTV